MLYFLIFVTGVYWGNAIGVAPAQFTDKATCEVVGEHWVAEAKAAGMRNPHYICLART